MVIQTICNIIILIGGVVGAILTIGKFSGIQFNFLKGKRKKLIKKDLDELLPQYFDKYMLEMQKELQEIKSINLKQNETIENLLYGIRDTLRYQIMAIYQKYKKTQQIPLYEHEKLEDTYKDYKKLDGNHYIDKYYERMQRWEIISNVEEGEEI